MTISPNSVLRARLDFEANGSSESFNHTFALPWLGDRQDAERLSAQLFTEIEKEMFVGGYLAEFKSFDFSSHPSVHFSIQQVVASEHLFIGNTREVWFEISNNFLEARYLLSQSRAMKQVELEHIKRLGLSQTGAASDPRILNIHLNKIDSFDRGVYLLTRTEDLLLLLLFVNLGNSLVAVDPTTKPDWQKDIRWEPVKEGLKKRGAGSNPYLDALSDQDYESILRVMQRFKGTQDVAEIIRYRDEITHRIHPSVDYPGFTGQLRFESKVGSVTKIVHAKGSGEVRHQFTMLYGKALRVFNHYVCTLGELKQVSRFG
jgi:hypothetical protein